MQLLVFLPCYVDMLFALYLLQGNSTALVVNAYVDVGMCVVLVHMVEVQPSECFEDDCEPRSTK